MQARETDHRMPDGVTTEQALHNSESMYRTLVESSPYCIHQLDADGRFLSMNRAGLQMLGEEDEASVIGVPYLSVVGDEDRERVSRLMEQAFAGEFSEFELRSAGGLVFLSNFVPLRGDDGCVGRLLGITQDITGRKRLEEESRRLAEQLRHAQKMEAVGQLAGGVAHDFNNTLMAILGNAELLLSRVDASPSQDERSRLRAGLETIIRAGERGAAVTSQLLTFSRKEMTSTAVLALPQVIEETRDLLASLLREDIDFQVNVEADLHPIRADAGQLGQVVMNLVLNAQDAMPRGGTLTVACSNVDVEPHHAASRVGAQAGPHVLLRVTDSGVGMDRETVQRIFEPFFTTKPIGKGTGLGLATVYAIVTQAGAHLSVKSEPGAGSTFELHFPAADERASDSTPTVTYADRVDGAAIHDNAVVLVCEDEESVRQIVCETLTSAGYSVLEAHNGKHALDVVARFAGKIDLLLTDVIMPELNGKQLADALLDVHPEMRVVYISGHTYDLIDEQPLRGRGHEFIQKPFKPTVLLQRIHAALSRRASAAAAAS